MSEEMTIDEEIAAENLADLSKPKMTQAQRRAHRADIRSIIALTEGVYARISQHRRTDVGAAGACLDDALYELRYAYNFVR